MSRDVASIRRLLLVLSILKTRSQGLTFDELAAEMDVSAKTIRRDLQKFLSVGIPLEETVGEFNRKTWRLKSAAQVPDLCFTYDEAAALYLGRRLLQPLAGTVLAQAADDAMQKVKATVGHTARDYLDHVEELFHFTSFGVTDYSSKAELIDAINLAAEDRQVIRICYQSQRATEPTFREVHPYTLAPHHGSWYLLAHDPKEDMIKTYKIDRIEEVETTQSHFERPEDFDAATYLAGSLGIYHGDDDIAVKIQFAPTVTRYVTEKCWHDSQKLSPQSDGSLIAEYRLSCTQEVKSLVLSFGSKAVVLEPESLRREIAEELAALVAIYTFPL